MNNRDITFVLKVQNDAKAGLQSLGVDFQKIVERINQLGASSGDNAQKGLQGIKAQAAAMKELLGIYKQAEQAQIAITRQEAQARAAKRSDTAKARTAEATSQTNIVLQDERAKLARSERLAAAREVRARARTAESRSTVTIGVGNERLRTAESTRAATERINATRAATAEDVRAAAATREAVRLANMRTQAEAQLARTMAATAAQNARSAASLTALNAREAENLRTVQARNRLREVAETARTQTVQTRAGDVQARAQAAQAEALAAADFKARQRNLQLDTIRLRNEALHIKNQQEMLILQNRQAAAINAQAIAAERLAAAQARAQAAQANANLAMLRTNNAQNPGNNQSGQRQSRGGLLSGLFRWGLGSPGSVGGNAGPGGRGGASSIFTGITGGAGAATTAVAGLQNAMRGLGAGYLIAEFIALADAMAQLKARVGLVTDGTLQQSLVLRGLVDVAQEARTGLNELGTVYYGLARNNATLGLSQREMLDVTRTISQSIALSGVNAQAAAFGLMQLSQAFGTGQLRGEELNSVLEQLPGLAQLIAKNIKLMDGTVGVAGPGALKTLAEQGKLTIRQVIEAIQAGAKEIDGAFKTLPVTVSQGMTVFKNGLQVFIGGFNEASGATQGLGKLLMNLGTALSSKEFVKFGVDVGDTLAQVANVAISILVPAFKILADVVVPLIKTLGTLALAFAAMKITATVALWTIGLAKAVSVLWQTMVIAIGVYRAAAVNMGALSAASFALSLATARAATGVKLLDTALMFLGKNPVVAILSVIAAGAVAIYTAMQLAKDGVDTVNEAAEELKANQKFFAGIQSGLISGKMLDADSIEARVERTRQALVRYREELIDTEDAAIAARLAVLDAQAAVREQGSTRTVVRAGSGGTAGGVVTQEKSSAQVELENAQKTAAQAEAALVAVRSSITSGEKDVEKLQGMINDALNTKPKVRGTDPTTEQINKIMSALGQVDPMLTKARDLKDVQELFSALSESTIGSNWLVGLTKLKTGIKDFEKLPENVREQLQKNTLSKAFTGWADSIKDNDLSKTLRDLRSEIAMLGEENVAGGPLPIERKLFELRKRLAAEQGMFTDPNSAAIRQQAEAARMVYTQEERLRVETAISASYRDKVQAARDESAVVNMVGKERRIEQMLAEETRRLRAQNAALTEEEARTLASKALPAMREIVDLDVSTSIRRTLSTKAREAALAVEEAQALLNMRPIERDAGGDVLQVQIDLAKQLDVSLAEVQRRWNEGFADLGKYAQEAADNAKKFVTDVSDARGRQAMVDLTNSIDEAARATNQAWEARLLVGDAAEREAFVQERINTLLRERPNLTQQEARATVEREMAPYDEAKLKARQYREAPVTGTIEGVKKGYAEFINEASNITQMFTEATRTALQGVQNAFVQLITTGKGGFKAFAASIMRDIAAMIIKFLVLQAIMAAIGFATGGVSIPATTGPTPYNGMGGIQFAAKGAAFDAAGVPQKIPAYADGGVFNGGTEVKKFARGGVVSSPTLFKMAKNATGVMGEAGPEAIMPLRRTPSGRLGIEVVGNRRRRREEDITDMLEGVLDSVSAMAASTTRLMSQKGNNSPKVVVQQLQEVFSPRDDRRVKPQPFAKGGIFRRAIESVRAKANAKPDTKKSEQSPDLLSSIRGNYSSVNSFVNSAFTQNSSRSDSRSTGDTVDVRDNRKYSDTRKDSTVSSWASWLNTVLSEAQPRDRTESRITKSSDLRERDRELERDRRTSATRVLKSDKQVLRILTETVKAIPAVAGRATDRVTTRELKPFLRKEMLNRMPGREQMVSDTKKAQAFATGGVVSKPTLFPMANGATGLMGEAGAEAIMPLRRLSNGRLGVEAQGASGGTVNNFSPVIQITIEGGKSGKPEENRDLAEKVSEQVSKVMDAKMAEFAQRETRPGGMFRRMEI